MSEFERHTKRAENKDGSYTVECRRGLWSVTAPTKALAIQEGVHYFLQYWGDGEYEDNPLEAIMRVVLPNVGDNAPPLGGRVD